MLFISVLMLFVISYLSSVKLKQLLGVFGPSKGTTTHFETRITIFWVICLCPLSRGSTSFAF